MVALLAVSCITGIARGLRSDFTQYKSLVISALIERCKEKKAVAGLREALDAVFNGVDESWIEDVRVMVSHKNPLVRTEGFSWVVRSCCAVKKVPGKSEVKILVGLGISGIDDGDVGVRGAAMHSLGVLSKLSPSVGGLLDRVDALKLAKIKEFAETAVVKVKQVFCFLHRARRMLGQRALDLLNR